MYNLSRKREKKKFPTTGKDNIKKLKGNCVYRWYKTYNGTLHLTWKDESLTNRRDADSKFNFPIPLEMFCTQLPGAERRFADTRRHTPAWCDSCSLTAQGWKDLLHQALWSCDFITRRPSCSGLRETPTSVETRGTRAPARPPESSTSSRVSFVLKSGWLLHHILIHDEFNVILLGQQPWALQTTARRGLDMLLC